MLDWHTFQICYPVEIKLLLLLYVSISVYLPVFLGDCVFHSFVVDIEIEHLVSVGHSNFSWVSMCVRYL